jgi:anti-sigma regulatory factor (Ser/Thr protein kinase)
MSLVSKSQIREDLRKQIADKQSAKKQEMREDLDYGMRLNLMARNMQKMDQERQVKQREMQFKLMTKQWDEMIKDKEEKKEIEKIFKN